ncbi:hypothetical protein ES288_A03G097800v1, partial [Gossypium darwinii]
RCHTGAETREHLFRDCPVAKEIWEKLNIFWPSSVANYDFLEVLITMFGSHSISKCRMITCALWAIWANRNRFLHEGESRSGSQVADFVLNYLKELDDLNHFVPKRRLHLVRWEAPVGSRVKINFDAAFNRN